MALLKLPLNLALLLVVGCSALYSSGSDVIRLTDSNFDELVSRGNDTWIVQFYAPWCYHSRKFVPEYKKAATRLKGIAKVGAVDSDIGRNLTRRFDIQSFPTVEIFFPKHFSPEEYDGELNARGLVDAIKLKK